MQTPKFLALPSSHSPAPPRHGLSPKRVLASFCSWQPGGSGEGHKSPVATAAAPCTAPTALLITAIIISFIAQHLAALASPGSDLRPNPSPPPQTQHLLPGGGREEPPALGTHKLHAEVTRGCGLASTLGIPPPPHLPPPLQTPPFPCCPPVRAPGKGVS